MCEIRFSLIEFKGLLGFDGGMHSTGCHSNFLIEIHSRHLKQFCMYSTSIFSPHGFKEKIFFPVQEKQKLHAESKSFISHLERRVSGTFDSGLIKQTQVGLFTDLTTAADVTECFYMSSCACVQLASAQIWARENTGRIKETLIVCQAETCEMDSLNGYLKMLTQKNPFLILHLNPHSITTQVFCISIYHRLQNISYHLFYFNLLYQGHLVGGGCSQC